MTTWAPVPGDLARARTIALDATRHGVTVRVWCAQHGLEYQWWARCLREQGRLSVLERLWSEETPWLR